jgi:SHS2 domain-containing protein
MEKPLYDIIDHTADMGIRVHAKTREGLFESGAAAFFDIIGEWGKPGTSHVHKIRLEGETNEDLFHGWLDELNFLHQTRDLVFFEFDVRIPRNGLLEATVRGRKINRVEDALLVEIKAVTHHELRVEEEADGWHASVIFDV